MCLAQKQENLGVLRVGLRGLEGLVAGLDEVAGLVRGFRLLVRLLGVGLGQGVGGDRGYHQNQREETRYEPPHVSAPFVAALDCQDRTVRRQTIPLDLDSRRQKKFPKIRHAGGVIASNRYSTRRMEGSA